MTLFKSIGLAGAVYVAGRVCGKFFGVTIGAKGSTVDGRVVSHLRWAVFAQAGLAVGLTMVVARRLPDIAPQITAIVLSAVMLFEIIGPLAVRSVLVRSGEAGRETSEVEPIVQ